jgi:phosphoserine phosphatase
MRHVLTLIADPRTAALHNSTVEAARSALAARGARVGPPDWLAPGTACDLDFDPPDPAPAKGDWAEAAARGAIASAPVDVVAQARSGRRKRLLVADMDSTIIENEVLDEMAAQAGLLERVAPITARAMAGEVDFAAALRERVALLEGFPVGLLDRVREAIRVTPGAAALVRTMRADGAYTAIVSSGFRPFTSFVCNLLGFHHHEGNELEVEGGRLTGRLAAPALDGERKASVLRRIARSQGFALSETIAVGNGANDLAMIGAAGFGVAFRAKPVLREAARARIEHGDLTALLYLQGYRAQDITA